MSDVILGIIIGASITIFTFSITQYFDYKKFKSEEKRWYAEHFLDLKIDTLQKLHVTFNHCINMYNIFLGYPKISKKDIKEVIIPKVEEYIDTFSFAESYLDLEGKDNVFLDALTFFTNAENDVIENKINKESWKEKIKYLRKGGTNRMKDLLDPHSLKEYIESILKK